ncbi:MAG: DNA polymerase III subunit delta [Alphaproteobacteria bacterium]|nr:DNA polymerase III subunit delta [Alphaproteobacteria bacterium]
MNFKSAQFENFCMHPDSAVKCVVLFGPNDGEIATLLGKCVKSICGDANDSFNCSQLDMDTISKDGGEIYAEFHAQSLMGGRRVIVVKNADNTLAPFLKDMLPNSPSENLLVLTSSTMNTKSSIIVWAKERTDIITVGCYEDREADIAQDTARMLQEKGLTTTPQTMQFLCARLSPDCKINQGEIDKLAMYMGKKNVVTTEDVKAAISDVTGANFEDLCYYTAEGEVSKACNMFNRLLNEGEEPATVIRQISYHFLKLLDSVAQLESGKTTDKVIQDMRPPLIFYRKDSYKKQLQIWHKEQLLAALSVLYDCERDCKTTEMPADLCAERAIMRLAGGANKLRAHR